MIWIQIEYNIGTVQQLYKEKIRELWFRLLVLFTFLMDQSIMNLPSPAVRFFSHLFHRIINYDKFYETLMII